MALLGAHMSIAGGYDKAALRAAEVGCDVLQLFTKNNNQWQAKPLSESDSTAFRQAVKQTGLRHPIAHSSYLINLASPDRTLWRKSVDSFVEELQRAAALGLEYVVVHPGSYGTGTEREGLRRVMQALDQADRRTAKLKIGTLLETTAGQGTSLGWRFEQLAAVLGGIRNPDRVGICFDTCHVFAAGYALAPPDQYRATMRALERAVGLKKVKAFHLNDSLRDQGSRVDRHAHIGRGRLGLEPFRCLLHDRRFRRVPMYIETPKGTENGEDLDVINLRTLRSL